MLFVALVFLGKTLTSREAAVLLDEVTKRPHVRRRLSERLPLDTDLPEVSLGLLMPERIG